MSVFQRLFGGSNKGDSKVNSPDAAIKQLSDVEEMLNKRQLHLESQIEEEKVNALRCSKEGNKRGALMALKRKKKHEKILLQLDGTLTTLENQRETLQNTSSNVEVLRVMRQAAKALETANQGFDADQVHELMDNLSEQHQNAEDIANAMSSPGLTGSNVYDDDELQRELEALAQDDLNAEMIRIGPLPDVPQPIKTKQQPDDMLRQLEAWAT